MADVGCCRWWRLSICMIMVVLLALYNSSFHPERLEIRHLAKSSSINRESSASWSSMVAAVDDVSKKTETDVRHQLSSAFGEGCSPQENSQCRKRLPNCLIIGAHKAGTMALLTFLSSHPDVVRNTSYTELNFFDLHYQSGLPWYLDQMPYSLPGQIVIEKSPNYFIKRVVPERIYKMNSSIRLLLIVRDPTERAISAYAMRLRMSKGKQAPFEQLVFKRSSDHGTEYRMGLLSESLYAKHLVRWMKLFNRSQIHIVDGDRLVKQPYDELVKVERFLNIQRFLTKEKFVFNKTKNFFCLNISDASETMCLPPSKGSSHPYIDKNVIMELREFFVPHNNRFFKLTNQTFDWMRR